MPQGTIWIEQRSKRGELLRVGIVCPECAQDTPASEGWKQRPWTGEPRECSECGDDLAPELKPAKCALVGV